MRKSKSRDGLIIDGISFLRENLKNTRDSDLNLKIFRYEKT